jgi:outer membrane protein OmpA-like peptidoglycan-associated protein/tetratricopeptide (TPR) repeat protein
MKLSGLSIIGCAVALLLMAGCGSTQKLKTGDQAFEQKSYAIAANLYKSEYSVEQVAQYKAQKAFRIGESYRLINDTKNAEKWYNEATKLQYPDALARYYLGAMLMANEKYDAAINEFKTYGNEDPSNKMKAFDMVRACELAKKLSQQKTNVAIDNLELNSSANEYAPVFYEGMDIVFSSDRGDALGTETYGWTGEKYSDLFMSKREKDGAYRSVVQFGENLNTGRNEGTPTFNKNFSEMYFTRCGIEGKTKSKLDDYCALFKSVRDFDGTWSLPERMYFFSDSVNVGQPFLSPDGKFMLFVATDAPDSYGGRDIYITYSEFGEWAEPVNLGNAINTPGDEMFPHIADDGMLYFASNGHAGMGGLDLFSAKKDGKGWKEPVNLKPPINSGADDFGIIIEKAKPANSEDFVKRTGYFTSSRPNGKGGDDLYKFTERNENIFTLNAFVFEKVFENPADPNSKVVDLKQVEGAEVVLKKYAQALQPVGTQKSDKNGFVKFDLEAENDYLVTATKDGYFKKSANTSTKGKKDESKVNIVVQVKIVLEKIFEEKEITIPNIYYDYDKTTLRPESEVILDTLIELLTDNPTVKLEIGSHTDSRGSNEYNEKLSQGRAESVVRYLVSKGIDLKRLTAKGYGESRPVNKCVDGMKCTEEEYQENRRTTFKVLAEKFIIESVTPDSIRVDPAPKE